MADKEKTRLEAQAYKYASDCCDSASEYEFAAGFYVAGGKHVGERMIAEIDQRIREHENEVLKLTQHKCFIIGLIDK
jgi:hypothetical protein